MCTSGTTPRRTHTTLSRPASASISCEIGTVTLFARCIWGTFTSPLQASVRARHTLDSIDANTSYERVTLFASSSSGVSGKDNDAAPLLALNVLVKRMRYREGIAVVFRNIPNDHALGVCRVAQARFERHHKQGTHARSLVKFRQGRRSKAKREIRSKHLEWLTTIAKQFFEAVDAANTAKLRQHGSPSALLVRDHSFDRQRSAQLTGISTANW
ncbi:Aste57867_656 [Aphanomyces stellatus]|uniref:Aste57867_656 protein n=1 Tax=Aphanomyces stellatus TaxID=120398 RepID=A0A485K3I5_9STRA|nr:hypothetical protein As57867_000655 [Aphanomyces stellatus]VFT77881.1 Aste57867_656 [Aphanomyces stellatus]